MTLFKASKAIWKRTNTQKWDDRPFKLTVQNMFAEACMLESKNKVRSKIQQGLPMGQLSFIFRAASNTLPTPINLDRWGYGTDPKWNWEKC